MILTILLVSIVLTLLIVGVTSRHLMFEYCCCNLSPLSFIFFFFLIDPPPPDISPLPLPAPLPFSCMAVHLQALPTPAQPPYPGCAFQFHVHALGTILEKPPTVGLGKIVAGDEVRQLFVAHLRALGSRDAAVESAAGLGLFIEIGRASCRERV